MLRPLQGGEPAPPTGRRTSADRSSAFGNCVERQAHAQNAVRQEAQRECKAEQDDPTFVVYGTGKKCANGNPAAFRAKYGKNAHKSDAFGRCVSQHAND